MTVWLYKVMTFPIQSQELISSLIHLITCLDGNMSCVFLRYYLFSLGVM